MGFTPLHYSGHYSACCGQTQAISTIANSLTTQQLIHLLRITNADGRTPLQLAEFEGKHAAAKLLQDYQTNSLLDIALQQADQTGSNFIQFFSFVPSASQVA